MRNWTVILFSLITASALAGEPVITCEPQTLRGVPGEPLRLTITIKTDRAHPIQLRVPALSNLLLRTTEKIPIQRTKTGGYIQKRVIIWQGISSGSIALTNLTIIAEGREVLCPDIIITVDAVEPAPIPTKETEE